MAETKRGVAPMARSTAILGSFSSTIIDRVLMMLNDAMTRMKASMAKVIHFSTAIIRNRSGCCCIRSSTRREAVAEVASSARLTAAAASSALQPAAGHMAICDSSPEL